MHAIDLFQAILTTLQNDVAIVNARELLQSLNLLVQLTPSGLWGEAMHSSGLFSHLLKTAIAGEVCSYLYPQMFIEPPIQRAIRFCLLNISIFFQGSYCQIARCLFSYCQHLLLSWDRQIPLYMNAFLINGGERYVLVDTMFNLMPF